MQKNPGSDSSFDSFYLRIKMLGAPFLVKVNKNLTFFSRPLPPLLSQISLFGTFHPFLPSLWLLLLISSPSQKYLSKTKIFQLIFVDLFKSQCWIFRIPLFAKSNVQKISNSYLPEKGGPYWLSLKMAPLT